MIFFYLVWNKMSLMFKHESNGDHAKNLGWKELCNTSPYNN